MTHKVMYRNMDGVVVIEEENEYLFRPTEKAVAIVKALSKKGLLRHADIGEGLLNAIETIIEALNERKKTTENEGV